jgi:hypothetical protein
MNLINKISSVKSDILAIDCGDTYITVEKRGFFDGKDIFSWTSISPTVGSTCDYNSHLVTEQEVKRNIEIMTNGYTTVEIELAIDHFFKKKTL